MPDARWAQRLRRSHRRLSIRTQSARIAAGLASESHPARLAGSRRSECRTILNIFFDLETKRTFDEVGGHSNIRKLGMAGAVTYHTVAAAYHRYTEGRVADLIAELKSADLVLGYNVLEFDYEVLRAYTDEALQKLPTLDLMQCLAQRLGFRPSLESIATATLGLNKSANGLQAVRWYRLGLIDKVLDYCEKDVEITRQVYEYGKHHRYVYYWDKQYQRQAVVVSW